MAIRWQLDSHIDVAIRARELGLTKNTAKDISFMIDVFKKIIDSEIHVKFWKNTKNNSPASQYEEVNGKNVIYVTESTVSYENRSFLLLSECMACCVECGMTQPEDVCGIIEQVFFEERSSKTVYAEYPQVQAERETDLGALEILFPTEERQKYTTPVLGEPVDLELLAEEYQVPLAVLERAMKPAYIEYCLERQKTRYLANTRSC